MRRLVMLAAVTVLTGAMGCGPGEEGAPLGDVESQPTTVEQPLYSTWTGYTSEELPPIHCGGVWKMLAYGGACNKAWCDEMSLGCKEVPAGATLGAVTWTPAFSEETLTPTICPPGTWVTGLACTGGYCDNLTLECTAVTGRTVSPTCNWSPNIADRSAAWRAPEGAYLRGAKCSGWWCEAISYYYCYMN